MREASQCVVEVQCLPPVDVVRMLLSRRRYPGVEMPKPAACRFEMRGSSVRPYGSDADVCSHAQWRVSQVNDMMH